MKSLVFALTLPAFVGLFPAESVAQSPAVLVRDIAPGPGTARLEIELPVAEGVNRAYFAADDGFLGMELWTTDGTRSGTRQVADLCPGRCSGSPQALTPSQGLLYFVAGNATTGNDTFWLWRSDGTDEGTYPLADLAIGAFGSSGPIGYLTPLPGGGVVFLVRVGRRHGYELWKSDGTRDGTRRIRALPGEFGLATPNNRPYPFIESGGPPVARFDWLGMPWVTDGTGRGTHAVARLPITLCEELWIPFGRLLIYSGRDAASGCEPWVTDGTAAETRRLRDLAAGELSSIPSGFARTRSAVYFSASDRQGRRLWKTDGTTAGTVRVRTPRPETPLRFTEVVAVSGDRVYFAADDGVHGRELWKTDGNPATTALVADLSPGPASTRNFFGFGVGGRGTALYFYALVDGATDLYWHTAGDAASTVPIHGPTEAVVFTLLGGRALFPTRAEGGAPALAINDGTTDGTRILFRAEGAASSLPAELVPTARGLLFVVGYGLPGGDVWRSDGRRSGTRLFSHLSDSPQHLFPGQGGAFLAASFSLLRSVAWTDGGPAPETVLVEDPEVHFPGGFLATGSNTSFFLERRTATATRLEVWGSDGSVPGTGRLATVDESTSGDFHAVVSTAGPEAGSATFLFQTGGSLVDRTSPLLSTDGTAGGTHAHADLGLAPHEQVLGLVASTNRTYAVTHRQGNADASRLIASDGTPGGTGEVFRIDGPFERSFITEAVALGDRLVFTGYDDASGAELWATDGTPEGTARVADLAPGDRSSAPSDLWTFGGRVFFSADDGVHGRELWVTDGTEAGTRRIEIRPGPRGSYPQAFAQVAGRLLFAADDGVHGLEIFTSDATAAGTRLVADVQPGRMGSSPRNFALYGSDLFFSAGRPAVGYELFRIPAEALQP